MSINSNGKFAIVIGTGEEPTITLRGELGFNNVNVIIEAVNGLTDSGITSISVDARELVFMDSTGVSVLVDLARTFVKRGGEVKLIPSSSQLSRILSSCGFSKLFKLQSVKESGVVEFEVPGRAEMISYIRARVADFALSMPFTRDDIEDIKLAVGEASTNAIRYGTTAECCNVGVRLEKRRDAMKICITDKGCGFNPDALCIPPIDDFSEGGRGILFMRVLMDEVKFHIGNPGTSVEMTKRFH